MPQNVSVNRNDKNYGICFSYANLPKKDVRMNFRSSMKNLFLIGGAMGVGKTSVCRILKQKLNNTVFLDGDWCWDSDPFQVTEETKSMVMDNICYLLNNFLRCSAYDNVIFCWVMHEQNIIDQILSKIDTQNCNVQKFSLICDEETLKNRLQLDIKNGIRSTGVIERSLARLKYYQNLDTVKINTNNKNPYEVAEEILKNLEFMQFPDIFSDGPNNIR